MKNWFKKIIVLHLALALALAPALFEAASAAEEVQSEPEKACQELKPDFEALLKEWSATKEKTGSTTQAAFEKSQAAYHSYVQCLFDFAESSILWSGGSVQGGQFQANMPNFPWMKPAAACLTPKKLNEIIKNTNTDQMLGPLLKTHKAYTEHLDAILNIYQQFGVEKGGDGQLLEGTQAFSQRIKKSSSFTAQIKAEKENALIAMNMAFISLRELRLSFVIHVQFQCMLNNLETYRKFLEDLRTIVTLLPSRLENASMSQ
jgi:hypothetical protein